MKNIKPHFKFNKQERSGVFFLLLIIVLLQVLYFVFRVLPFDAEEDMILVDIETQAKVDALKEKALQKDSVTIYPFNPNFITDYKGYTLGMSHEEIDRLHLFRKQNKFANTAEEFQKVTQVSDSLLAVISPYFKFPDWTQESSKRPLIGNDPERSRRVTSNVDKTDLNATTANELKQVRGIGEKLSARIIKFRDRLGGFLVDEQLYDVYGLDREVAERALKKFKVLKRPEIDKININLASAAEIAKLVYIQKYIAERIVDYRNINGTIVSFDELTTIQDFPADKIERIALYLQL
ncbi:MAG: helix-hairpin-helix domain-containing protein [Flavobacteriaceae bacterium]